MAWVKTLRWRRDGRRLWHPQLRILGEVALIAVAAFFDVVLRAMQATMVFAQGWGGWNSFPAWVALVLTAGIYPALLLRWRYPRVVFTLFLAHAVALLLLWGAAGPSAGLFIALYPLARRSSSRIAGGALGACVAMFAVMSYMESFAFEYPTSFVGSGDQPNLRFVANLGYYTVLVVLVWIPGRFLYASERRGEQLRRKEAEAAVRAERLHLARELHDIVSHSVSAMLLQAAGARTLVSPDDQEVRSALESIEATGVEAMGELHRLLGLLRATGSEGDGVENVRLPSLHDVDSVVSSARASGVDVEVLVEGHPTELDRSVGLTAFRIVQEALTNTIKYAGRGASARLHFRWEADGLTLTIRDRAGFGARQTAKLSSGHGLTGLTERVHLVGGFLEAGPVSDGFLLHARLPTSAVTPYQSISADSQKDTS